MDEHRRLVLVGGGGHCKSVLDAVLTAGYYLEIIITDQILQAGSEVMGCKVAGTDEVLPELYRKGFRNAFVSVGSMGGV